MTVTEKIADQTDSDNCLTVYILNQLYLSKATSKSIFNSTVTLIFFKKQADHWDHHVDSTSSKKIHHNSPENSSSPEMQHSHMTHTEKAELDQQLSTTMKEDSNSIIMKEEHQ